MTKIKICGITKLEDGLVAVEAGVDLLGFIFYEPSPRYVTPEVVRKIVSGVKGQVSRIGVKINEQKRSAGPPQATTTPQFVGVFVNSPLDTVRQILDFCQLDAAQLHGEEPSEFLNQFEGRAFKALRPKTQSQAETMIQTYDTFPSSPTSLLPGFLIDAYHPSLYGGTGHVTDWTMAANIARRYPIMLAGSLTPANVAEAIQAVRPWGVDVSSGVELEKGKKDHQKVREFVRAVREV